MLELISLKDPYKMNWIEGEKEWGTVKCPEQIQCEHTIQKKDDTILERFKFTNVSNTHIFTSLQDISIYATFNDDYASAEECMYRRCHTHIWCGGDISYVMALRMGGEAPHLGLTLTEGSLSGYSIERDIEKSSNDRGDFILHPSPVVLAPGESFSIAWILFWHNGKSDFYEKLKKYNKKYIHIEAANYMLFEGEEINITIEPEFEFGYQDIDISINGERKIDAEIINNKIIIKDKADCLGERKYDIEICGIKTFCNVFVQPSLEKLAKDRCEFIVKYQQFNKANDHLNGAYLVYDNEEKHCVYSNKYDLNCARERVGMGLLISEYLKNHENIELSDSLKKYVEFVKRELFDEESGEIYNDYMRDNSYLRLYNYSWYSLLFLQLYDICGKKEYINYAYKIMVSFYEQGGVKFYAIELPILKLMTYLEKEGFIKEYEIMIKYLSHHAQYIIDMGLLYPPHEVHYEQSIVAPGANILLQMYELTGNSEYIENAKIQLSALELFNGLQPDYHLYETAIRHWDGFWFGKRKLYGDTFPHYWSALTGNIYEQFGKLTNNNDYIKKAEASLRGVLSLIHSGGTASCAYIYPISVNGYNGKFYDPYANDQDWALYFMLRYVNRKNQF